VDAPGVTDFKAYFFRDFPYGTTVDTVQAADITNALAEAAFNANEAILTTQAKYTLGYLLLAAHYLVVNLRASSQGIAGKYTWLPASQSAGSIAASYQIPQRILDNPELAMLAQTPYGARYLSLILPLLAGQVFAVCGRTHA
jgi:hypothetical protein